MRLMQAEYMKYVTGYVRLAAIACVIVFCSACKPSSSAGGGSGTNPQTVANQVDPVRGHLLHAQPKLPTIKVWLGAEELITEIAREPVQIATGMMFRTSMAENEGMVFVFPVPGPKNFYMRNCTVPLSAAYIAPNGTILEIIKLDPGDEVGVQSKSNNIQFVLEVPQGWFDRHNVHTGAVIRTERGSLMETFFRR